MALTTIYQYDVHGCDEAALIASAHERARRYFGHDNYQLGRIIVHPLTSDALGEPTSYTADITARSLPDEPPPPKRDMFGTIPITQRTDPSPHTTGWADGPTPQANY